MNRLIFDFLFSKGIRQDNLEEYFSKLNKRQIGRFVERLNEKIPETLIAIHEDDYTLKFLANEGFSGNTFCTNISCGLNRVLKLERIAALYSDVIYIFNPFGKYYMYFEGNRYRLDFIRERVVKDLYIVFVLEEVLLAERVKFITKEFYKYCQNCYPDFENYQKSFQERFIKTLTPELLDIYKNQCEFYVEEIAKTNYTLTIQPKNDEILEHSSMSVKIEEVPSQILKRAFKRKSKKLWKNELNKEITSIAYDEYLHEIYSQSLFSNLTSSNFLSDRLTDLKLLPTLSNTTLEKKSVNTDVNTFTEGLSHSLPLINDLNIKDVMELREKEGEAFKNYRETFQEFLFKTEDLSPDHIKEAFKDEVLPELNKIDLTVKNFKEIKKRSIIANTVSLTGFVYIGLFSGILPSTVGTAVTALSAFNNASCIVKEALSKVNPNIRNNKYYFIWKLMKQHKTSR